MKARRALSTKSATVDNTVKSLSDWGFSDAALNRASHMIISPVGANVMITWDGTDPTSTLGHPVVENYWASISGASLSKIKMIRQGDTNATVTITLEH